MRAYSSLNVSAVDYFVHFPMCPKTSFALAMYNLLFLEALQALSLEDLQVDGNGGDGR